MDPLVEDFFQVAQQGADQTSGICRLVQSQLPKIKAALGNGQIDDICLIADAGEFLIHAFEILGRFAIDIVYGQDIITYTQRRLEKLEEESDLSDLGVADYLDDKLSALRFIAQEIDAAVKNSRTSWKESPSQPHLEKVSETRTSTNCDPLLSPTVVNSEADTVGRDFVRQGSTSSISRTEISYPSPQSSLQGSTFMEHLKQRGKGAHYCQLGHACTKGGVNSDGTLVNFERNSAYRLVMNPL